MPRSQRIHFPGAVYHITARGVDKRKIFNNAADYETMLEFTALVHRQENAKLLAFALMPNHLHFLIRVLSTELFKIMQRILTRYAIYFNNQNERSGHLFQGRYKPMLCMDDTYFKNIIRYIHQNPLRAGLESKIGDWPWTSHRDYLGLSADPVADVNYGLSFFSDEKKSALERYRLLMNETDPETITNHDSIVPLSEKLVFLQRSVSHETETIETIASTVAAKTHIPSKLIASGSRRRKIVEAKRIFALEAVLAGHKSPEIAQFLGCTISNVCRLLDKPESQRQILELE